MDEAAVAELRAVHRGPVIGPADVRFDGARRSFNALIEARPELIVRPVDDADVAAAIGFARARGLGVSVRGGGHSVAGHSVGHGSVMIDLRLLREVTVEVDAQRALVGGGACWNDADAATQAAELALPGGTYGDTGVAGLTLTGGIGHLGRCVWAHAGQPGVRAAGDGRRRGHPDRSRPGAGAVLGVAWRWR